MMHGCERGISALTTCKQALLSAIFVRIYAAANKWETMGIHFDMGHLSHVIVRQIGFSVISISRAMTQIPIEYFLLNAYR